jgi:hypothetical protein
MQNTLTESANKENVINLEKLSKTEASKVIQNWVSIEKLSKLSELIPNISKLQKDAFDSMQPIVDGVKTTQAKSIDSADKTLDSTMQVLSKLADKTTTDESLITLAEITAKVANDHATQAKEISKNNNETWKVITQLAMVTTVGIVGLAFKILKNK